MSLHDSTATNPQERLRTRDEIVRAHDAWGLLILEPPFHNGVDEKARRILICQMDVLCWVLHHDHNTVFAKNLALIEQALAELGVQP
jgi:hypothetical protein